MTTTFTAAIVIASMLGSAPPAWQIQIDRPMTVGQKYRLEAAGEQSMTMKDKEGKPLKTDRMTARLNADITVGKVDSRGIPIELQVSVQSLTLVGPNERVSTPLKNESIVATRTGPQETFTASFGEITGPARRGLRMTLSVQPADAPRTDDVFPPGGKRKLGESWGIDAAQMARAMSTQGSTTDPKHIKGKAELKRMAPCGKETCFDLRFEFTVADIKPAEPPIGMKWKGANARTVGTGLLPLDSRKQRLSETQEDWMTARVIMDGERRTIEYHRSVTRKVTPL